MIDDTVLGTTVILTGRLLKFDLLGWFTFFEELTSTHGILFGATASLSGQVIAQVRESIRKKSLEMRNALVLIC